MAQVVRKKRLWEQVWYQIDGQIGCCGRDEIQRQVSAQVEEPVKKWLAHRLGGWRGAADVSHVWLQISTQAREQLRALEEEADDRA